ncbi:GGDEF domain-containing protein [Patulibacter minatonensis]|uniref:GGDEF domain-containing protein n=1 Tax=Patulibacter minatonensis TaxID=298163 RepID=UPI00047A0FC7|nr:GGDEF domain-containing protein [Patulibacter minatonensis]
MSAPTLPTDASSLEALRTAVDAMGEQVTLLGPGGRVLHVNRARRASEQADADDADRGRHDQDPLSSAASGDAQSRAIAAGVRSVLSGERDTFEVEYSRGRGRAVRWFHLRASTIGVDGVGAVVVHTDVTRRREAERAQHHRADRDGLTGLANRRLLAHRLEELLVDGPVGLISLHVHATDPSRPIHLTGDRDGDVLQETAHLVEQLVAEDAVTGRHGADRFVVLLPGVEDDAVRRAALPLSAGWHARLRRRHDLTASIETLVAHPGDDAHEVLDRATGGEHAGADGTAVLAARG